MHADFCDGYMDKDDPLFDLIKSLDKNEKGYFKKYVGFTTSGKENNYIALFDALDKMKVYDEQKLLALVEGYSFINYLSRQKNYLYELILKVIDSYYVKSNVEIKLNSAFSSVKILYDKGLLDQCEKLLMKAKKLIRKHYLHSHGVQLHRWENKIAVAKLNISRIRESNIEQLENIDLVMRIVKYIELYGDLYSLIIQTGNDVPKNRTRQFEKFISHPLLNCDEKTLTFHERQYYHRILTICYESMMQYEKADMHSLKRLHLFQKRPELIHLHAEQYINAVNNRIDILIRLDKYGEADELCETLDQISFPTLFLNARRAVKFYLGSFKISARTLNFKNIIDKIEDAKDFISKNSNLVRPDEKIQLYFFIAYALFAERSYKQSLRYLNYILNSRDKIQEDFQVAARIMNLVLHYELGNVEYLGYAVKSSMLYIKKKKRLTNAEKLFLKFIEKNLLQTQDPKELTDEFKKLKHRVEAELTSEEQSAFSNFNLLYWIESKIKQNSYSAVLKKEVSS